MKQRLNNIIMKKILLIIVLILLGFILINYFGIRKQEVPEEEITEEMEMVDVANPAAVYCKEQEGTLETFVFEEEEDAYCIFQDGSKCWQWDFYRKECDKGQLKITVLHEGVGKPIEMGEVAVVHYSGMLLDGTKFDSSMDRGEPFLFILGAGNVIQGWEQGVLGMKVNEKRELILKPEMAYGEVSIGEIIPSNATLIFEIDLLEIQ